VPNDLPFQVVLLLPPLGALIKAIFLIRHGEDRSGFLSKAAHLIYKTVCTLYFTMILVLQYSNTSTH
jgi:hypothetical protein